MSAQNRQSHPDNVKQTKEESPPAGSSPAEQPPMNVPASSVPTSGLSSWLVCSYVQPLHVF